MMDYSEKFERVKKAAKKNGSKLCTKSLDVNLSLYKLYKGIDEMFQKRIHIVRDHTGSEVLPTIRSMAMRYNCVIVDVQSVMKCASKCESRKEEIENQLEMRSYQIDCKNKYYPSNFTPELVMSIIKDYIASLPYSSRDIILFNYPAADLR